MFHRDLKKYTQRKLTHTCTHAYLSSTYVTIEANRNTSDIGTKTYPIVVKIFLWISVISCRDKSPHTIFCIWVWSLLRPQLSPSHKLFSLALISLSLTTPGLRRIAKCVRWLHKHSTDPFIVTVSHPVLVLVQNELLASSSLKRVDS